MISFKKTILFALVGVALSSPMGPPMGGRPPPPMGGPGGPRPMGGPGGPMGPPPMGGPMGPPPMGGPMGPPPMGGPMGPPPMGPGGPMGPPPMGGPPPPCGSRPMNCGPPLDPKCPNTNTEANKKLVLDFYQQAFGDKDSTNIERFLSPNFIEHNPNEPDGPAGIKGLIDNVLAGQPKEKVDFKLVLAEKDLVALRVRLNFLGTEYATGDFFRIGCDGKIAEHWDAVQDTSAISPNSPNPHPFW